MMEYNRNLMDRPETTAFFTGHRVIPGEEISRISELIFRCISDAYQNGYRRFYCGCALGFDTLAAFQTVRLREIHSDVRLSLAVPCESQSARWTDKDKGVYHRILSLADDKTILSPVYYDGVMLARNRYMADRSSLCICYLRYMRGGTASTVRYALSQDHIHIINLAVSSYDSSDLLRENAWNYMYISPSAGKNAVTVPLHLMQERKLTMKSI